MKKIKLVVACLLVLTLCCNFCGCGSSGTKTLSYKEYNIGSISYEIPEEFSEYFSVYKNDGFNEELQEFYLESDIFRVLKGSLPNLRFNKTEKHGKYEVYLYTASTTIGGEKTEVDVAGIGYNNSIHTFVFIWENDFVDQKETIYMHFLNSLK